MNFDRIISLGYNCEVSFLIEDYWGKLDPYPFSWGYVKDRNAFLYCLDHLDTILAGDIWFEPWACMYLCRNSMISFHPKMNSDQLINEDGSENLENRTTAIAELRSRISHMVRKMNSLFAGTENVLFLAKVKSEDKNADFLYVQDFQRKIRNLKNSGGGIN